MTMSSRMRMSFSRGLWECTRHSKVRGVQSEGANRYLGGNLYFTGRLALINGSELDHMRAY